MKIPTNGLRIKGYIIRVEFEEVIYMAISKNYPDKTKWQDFADKNFVKDDEGVITGKRGIRTEKPAKDSESEGTTVSSNWPY